MDTDGEGKNSRLSRRRGGTEKKRDGSPDPSGWKNRREAKYNVKVDFNYIEVQILPQTRRSWHLDGQIGSGI